MAINKKLIHFETFSNFNSQKLSANKENTQYTLGVNGEIQTGFPDILYQSIVYIKDTQQQWTHGQLYNNLEAEMITASELRKKIFLEELIPGKRYLIKDYVNIHPYYFEKLSELQIRIYGDFFDILVQAISKNSLSEFAEIIYKNNQYNYKFNNWKIKYDLFGNNHVFNYVENFNIYDYLPVTTTTYNNKPYTLFYSNITNLAFWQKGNIREPQINTCYVSKFDYTLKPDINEINNPIKICDFSEILSISCIHNGIITYMCDDRGNEAYFDFIHFMKYNKMMNIHAPLFQLDPFFAPEKAVDCKNNKIGPYYENNLLSIPPIFIGPFEGQYMMQETHPLYIYKNNIINNPSGELMLCGSNNIINNSCGYYYGDDNTITNSDCFGTIQSSNISDSYFFQTYQTDIICENLKITDSILNSVSAGIDLKEINYISYSKLNTVAIKPFETRSIIDIQDSNINKCSFYGYSLTNLSKTGCNNINIYGNLYTTFVNVGFAPSINIVNVISGSSRYVEDTIIAESSMIISNNLDNNVIIPFSYFDEIKSNNDYQNNQKNLETPLCFIARENNLSIKFSNNLQYSLDNNIWNNLPANTLTPSIESGEKLYFKGNLIPNENGIGKFTVNGSFNLSGNTMSLLNSNNFNNMFNLSNYEYVFLNLFENCTGLIKIVSNILPAKTLSNSCYSRMFYNCSNLKYVPKTLLPATSLSDNCYHAMFCKCVSLQDAPDLPAEIMSSYAYSKMFSECTKLSKTPELIAHTLAPACYLEMFKGCSGIIECSNLPALVLQNDCYNAMFRECVSLKIGPQINAIEVDDYCCNAMFYGCTSLQYIGDLLSLELKNSCYNAMFYKCTSLINTPKIHANVLAPYCCNAMFYMCSNIKSIKLLSRTLVDNCYRYMFAGCTNLSQIIIGFTTEISQNYTLEWVNGVSLSGNFEIINNINWDPTFYFGTSGIPATWEITYPLIKYLTIEALENGLTAKLSNNACQYSTDGKTWINLSKNTPTCSINSGEKLYFKGTINPNSNTGIGTFTISKPSNVSGNIMSMLYGDNVSNAFSLENKDGAFRSLFMNCFGIQNASDLLLPATKLSNGCYYEMFAGCISLKTAPVLPATTLAKNCYVSMFQDCSLLTTAPELLAPILVENCYMYMFNGCSSLTYIKMLATDISAQYCLAQWTKGISKYGTFVKSKDCEKLPLNSSGIIGTWTIEEI